MAPQWNRKSSKQHAGNWLGSLALSQWMRHQSQGCGCRAGMNIKTNSFASWWMRKLLPRPMSSGWTSKMGLRNDSVKWRSGLWPILSVCFRSQGAGGKIMAANPNSIVQEAVDTAISERGEIGLQVAAYVDGKQVVDIWGGL